MIKYNYTGAAALWDELYNLCFNPWDFSDRQKERRDFMRELTRGNYSETVDFLKQEIDFILPAENATSRCYDFDLIKHYESLITKLVLFKGVKSGK